MRARCVQQLVSDSSNISPEKWMNKFSAISETKGFFLLLYNLQT